MAPEGSRKRVKTNTSSGNASQNPLALIRLPEEQNPVKETPKAPEASADKTEGASWFFGSWPRKSLPADQRAAETIAKTNNKASETRPPTTPRKSKPRLPRRSSSLQLTYKHSNQSRGFPADATTTRINATSEGSFPRLNPSLNDEISNKEESADRPMTGSNKSTSSKGKLKVREDQKATSGETSNLDHLGPPDKPDQVNGTSPQSRNNAGPGWLGWFSKPVMEPETMTGTPPELAKPVEQAPSKEVAPPTIIADGKSIPENDSQETIEATLAKRSWLTAWNNPKTPESVSASASTKSANGNDKPSKPPSESLAIPNSNVSQSKASSIMASSPPNLPGDASKSAGWIFWSRGDKKVSNTDDPDEPHEGEIAISDTPSQKRPKRASISVNKTQDLSRINKDSQSSKGKESVTPDAADSKSREPKIIPGKPPASGQSKVAESEAAKQLKKASPSLVMPSFKDTLSVEDSPSIMRQLGRFLTYNKVSEPVHVHLMREPPRIKNAIAIGVHGYFPAPFIRSVLGQPTGTSIKFADMATKAIKSWTQNRGYSCEIKTAALEGEGRIHERVDLLWKLLLNWVDEIKKADFIMLACHSQGVPVTTMLVAKLITCGLVDSARIGICAMAGVNLGPFTDYRSRWFGERANELFDFSDPSSTVSRDYLAALDVVVRFGVRVVYIGSIDDQLVSLESSTFSPLSHPYIYRAVFVDGRIHTPNFIANLVGFTLKLRNLGVADHGFIREISPSLAGSLYSGEGHSRIYEDDAVYYLAVQFALETTSPVKNAPLLQSSGTSGGAPSANPYLLPFAMRGLLEEPKVKNDLNDEAAEILRQFDDWKPTSKVLKDVKFRLEGIRWKL